VISRVRVGREPHGIYASGWGKGHVPLGETFSRNCVQVLACGVVIEDLRRDFFRFLGVRALLMSNALASVARYEGLPMALERGARPLNKTHLGSR
jgi:hypothetical protein